MASHIIFMERLRSVHKRLEDYQYTFFEKANAFLEKVKFIESITKKISPKTITTINEIGTIIDCK